jgi:DNA replication protein DnaC
LRETLVLVCEREIARKDERRIEMTLKLARFPFVRDLSGFDFSAQVVATAILDRLLHHSHVITIRGDSYRLKEKRRSGLLQKATTAEGKPEKKA